VERARAAPGTRESLRSPPGDGSLRATACVHRSGGTLVRPRRRPCAAAPPRRGDAREASYGRTRLRSHTRPSRLSWDRRTPDPLAAAPRRDPCERIAPSPVSALDFHLRDRSAPRGLPTESAARRRTTWSTRSPRERSIPPGCPSSPRACRSVRNPWRRTDPTQRAREGRLGRARARGRQPALPRLPLALPHAARVPGVGARYVRGRK
jgi:hypothetical protein